MADIYVNSLNFENDSNVYYVGKVRTVNGVEPDDTGDLVVDSTPTSGSDNLVSSDGIYDAINTIQQQVTYQQIQNDVQSGTAESKYPVGTQLTISWSDGSTSYDWLWDVVAHQEVETESGLTVPGMFIQAHYTNPTSIQYNARQAFYYTDTEIAAGTTLHFTVGAYPWYTDDVDKVIQFTLTSALPANGQIVFNQAYNATLVDATVTTYEQFSTTAIETCTMSEGSNGTDLGTIGLAINGNLNGIQSALLGYNRWSQSAVRQYLNSSASAGSWQSAANNWDRPCTQLSSIRGFMAGFDSAFLNIVNPIKVSTATNTVTDGGGTDVTYDTFFLPSLEQMYITPQADGVEGDYWEYWQDRLGLTSPAAQGSTYSEFITYAVNATTTAQYVWLRSARRSYSSNAWGLNSSGHVDVSSAHSARRLAPACVIC